MKRIALERLIFHNFKGFRDFTLSAHGGNVDAFGNNGSGKTTLFDGFTWLLSGKDSNNRTDFEIKELDSTGNVRQHKLEHEVEGIFLVNGKRKAYRRVYAEKWTKKRGALTDSLEGHETAYYLDGVPVTKKEYDADVAQLMPEEMFKLLTSPTYFNEQIKWQDRRKLLLEVCGDVTDAEVIHSNKELQPLEGILRERDIDKHKAVVAERMKRINQEIKDIPIRVSEAQRGMPEVAELSEEVLHDDLQLLQQRVADKEQELVRLQNGGQTAELQRQVAEIDSKQLGIKTMLQTSALDAVARQREHVTGLQRELDSLIRTADDYQYKIRTHEQRITNLDQERAQLRSEFTTVNAEGFTHTANDDCPACGQLLPEHRRQEVLEKAQAEFNRKKADRLEAIQSRGRAAKSESDQLTEEIEQFRIKLEQSTEQQQLLTDRVQADEMELSNLRSNVQDPSNNEEYRSLQEERSHICRQMDEIQQNTAIAQQAIRENIVELQREISSYQGELAKFDQVRRQQARITELDQQEKALASEYERLQHELFLIEEFTRGKVSMLQSRIDSKFKYARFRLFEEQINGGLREVCDTLYNGVPYNGGLNNAARINVGLDIINTLSEHFGVTAPIFVDNAESVTQLIHTDTQLIRLVVSEQDKQLRIETKNEIREAM